MSYLSPAIGYLGLWHHPARWLAQQFTVYLSAAVIAGTLFVIGAGVYAYLAPPMPVESPPIPLKKPAPQLPMEKAPPPVAEGALISQLKGKEIGVPILMQGQPYGVVTEVRVDEQGTKRFVVIEEVDTKQKSVWPYNVVNWVTEESARMQWSTANERVIGSVKGLWGSVEEGAAPASSRPEAATNKP